MHQVTGDKLIQEDQKYVLSAYVYRYTKDHRPNWPFPARFPVQFASDRDWLVNTLFKVRDDGRLDGRGRYCESYPTWPENPELRKEGGFTFLNDETWKGIT